MIVLWSIEKFTKDQKWGWTFYLLVFTAISIWIYLYQVNKKDKSIDE